jgi:hypothetical protein
VRKPGETKNGERREGAGVARGLRDELRGGLRGNNHSSVCLIDVVVFRMNLS